MSRHHRTARSGFTLLETVLAVALGSLVLASALSMFMVIQRAQDAVFGRADSNSELARVQRTMQRTFTSMLMLPADAPPPARATATTEEAASDSDAPADTDPSPTDEGPARQPRLVLQADPRFPGRTFDGRPIQRLEVVLSSTPLPGSADRVAANAWADSVLELDRPDDQTPGLRGAFVLSEPAPEPRETSDIGGWSLWWIPREGDRVRVASGIRRLHWVVARFQDGAVQRVEEYEATAAEDLPDFVEVQVETIAGVRGEFMFEMAWSVGAEPEPPAEPGESADGGAADATDGAVDVPTISGVPLAQPRRSTGGQQ